jgi:hypothetical protein
VPRRWRQSQGGFSQILGNSYLISIEFGIWTNHYGDIESLLIRSTKVQNFQHHPKIENNFSMWYCFKFVLVRVMAQTKSIRLVYFFIRNFFSQTSDDAVYMRWCWCLWQSNRNYGKTWWKWLHYHAVYLTSKLIMATCMNFSREYVLWRLHLYREDFECWGWIHNSTQRDPCLYSRNANANDMVGSLKIRFSSANPNLMKISVSPIHG